MKKFLLLLLVTLFLASCGSMIKNTSEFKYNWQEVPMDSTWNEIKDSSATQVIAKYKYQIAPLTEIIGYSTNELRKKEPESPLSNFAVDVIREAAIQYCMCDVDLALTNFGGIRSEMPKGAVRVYDIFSIFPFNNYIVIADIKGKELKKIFDQMAKSGQVEVLSNVEIVIDGYKLKKAYVGGRPIDDDKVYKLATINFLLEGGDGLRVKKYSEGITETNIFIRDAIVEHIKKLTAAGKKINPKSDGRVIVKNSKREQ